MLILSSAELARKQSQRRSVFSLYYIFRSINITKVLLYLYSQISITINLVFFLLYIFIVIFSITIYIDIMRRNTEGIDSYNEHHKT